METKICFKCNRELPVTEFYKHSRMADGYLGKCKHCTRADTQKRYELIIATPEGLESERKRGREKYKRLNYKDKHKPSYEQKKAIMERHKEKYPEKVSAKSASYHIDCPDGMERHHWSYNKDHYKDVLFLTTEDHSTAHRFMVYDQERMMYRTTGGVLLDSRESHCSYIMDIIEKENTKK